ncbi:MAG: prepilin-type N-terminal cleavage/methylation domain-containing protein, partial [Verrucomicrobiaceae bacterium]
MRANRHLRQPSGFTLIEVLVVVCIILVLVAVAFNAGKSMQVKSRQVTSANNLRQWGVAMAGHTADHNGALPRRGQGRQKLGLIDRPEDWFNVLPPYLGEKPYHELV